MGVAGAAVAARGTFSNILGHGQQQSTPSQNYGYGYNYNSAPLTTQLTTGSYPSAGYYTNQNFVPSTYTPGYNTETAAYGSGVGYSGPSVQTGNIGYAGPSVASANIGYTGPSFSVQSQIQPYAYRSAPLPPQGKAVYVVCDQQH